MGGCQNYGPFLGTLNNRSRILILGTQKGTIILTTTHMRGSSSPGRLEESEFQSLRQLQGSAPGCVRSGVDMKSM